MQIEAHGFSKIPKPGSNPTLPSPRAVRPAASPHPRTPTARILAAAGPAAGGWPAIFRKAPSRTAPGSKEIPTPNASEEASPRVEKPDRASPADRCPGPHQSRGRHTLSSSPHPPYYLSPPSAPLGAARKKAKRDGREEGRGGFEIFAEPPRHHPLHHHHHHHRPPSILLIACVPCRVSASARPPFALYQSPARHHRLSSHRRIRSSCICLQPSRQSPPTPARGASYRFVGDFGFPLLAGCVGGSGWSVLFWSAIVFGRFGVDYPGRVDVGDVG
ncbi:unnamed protein product [Urochloa humidicola]